MENFNIVPSQGKFGDSIEVVNENFLLAKQGIDILENIVSPNTNYVTAEANSQTTSVTEILPAIGSVDTIYRVGNWNGIAYDVTSFSEYAWYENNYKHLSTKSQVDDVFDISVYKSAGGVLAKFGNLTAALGANGANVPVGIRKGGMSIKFVQTSDNKYLQYRLMADEFTTDVTKWQGVDNEPTAESENLVKSGGIYLKIKQEKQRAEESEQHLQESINSVKEETLEENREMVNSILEYYAPIEITGDVNNAADEEDLTSINIEGTDVLKFKDKVYNPLVYSGIGRVYLRKNMINGVNTLTQDMLYKDESGSRVPNTNTIYVIQYDYDLNGRSITVPDGCVLQFDGGSLKNGTLKGNYTVIESSLMKIFDSDITLLGRWNNTSLYPEWFGAKGDGETDDTAALQKTIDMASLLNSKICQVTLLNTKTYNISTALNISSYVSLCSDYICRDKSYNGTNKPKIVVTSPSDAIHLVTREGLGTSIGRIVLYNLAIIGHSSTADIKAISYKDNSATIIEKCRFEGLFLSNFKYGIYVEAGQPSGESNPTLNGTVITDLSIQKNVGIGIYLKIHDIYDLIIENSHIYYPYIGGVLIDTSVITTPITFRNCTMEGCGYGYNLSDYNENGAFAINVKSGVETESVNIDKCYFEANGPFKRDDRIEPTEIESSTGEDGYKYISQPDWDKTATVIINGPQVSIQNSIFSEFYQMVGIVDAGKLIFDNNIIYVMQFALTLGMFTKDIVRVKDTTNSCKFISVSINLENLTEEFYTRANNFGVLNPIKLASGTSPQKINTDVNAPYLGQVYKYNYRNSSNVLRSKTLYYDGTAADNGNGTPYAPIKYFDSLISALGYFDKGDTVTVILRTGATISNGLVIQQGVNVIFKPESEQKAIVFNSILSVSGSTVSFYNINIKKGSGSISAEDAKIIFSGCKIEYTATSELVNCKAYCTIIVRGSTFTLTNDSTPHYLSYATLGSANCIIYNTTIPNNLYYTTQNYLRTGTLAQKPSASVTKYLAIGSEYFASDWNTNGGKLYWNGTNWVDATGAIV